MTMTITQNQENLLLHRKEIRASLSYEGATPSNAHVTDLLAKELKVDAGVVVLRHIYSHFGRQQAEVEAVVYADAESRKKIEPLCPQEKKKLKEEKKNAAGAEKKEGE